MDQYFEKKIEEDVFGILEIPTLNLKNPIYNLEKEQNHVDQNIELLEETISKKMKNSIIVLASHSGNGPHAYFKNLSSIKEADSIFFYYQNQKQEYQFFKKEEVLKTGVVYLENYDFPCLILITCSKTKNQIQEIYYAKFIKNICNDTIDVKQTYIKKVIQVV